MNRKEAEARKVHIYWWNMGKKHSDYIGPLNVCLKSKGIRIRKSGKGYKAFFSLSNTTVEIRSTTESFVTIANDAIKTYLTLLGDKAVYFDIYNREFKINWR